VLRTRQYCPPRRIWLCPVPQICHVRGDLFDCSSSHHVGEQVVVGVLAVIVPRPHVGRSPRVGADARPSQAPRVVEGSCSGDAETGARLPQVHHRQLCFWGHAVVLSGCWGRGRQLITIQYSLEDECYTVPEVMAALATLPICHRQLFVRSRSKKSIRR
jgi:hypothetical protein